MLCEKKKRVADLSEYFSEDRGAEQIARSAHIISCAVTAVIVSLHGSLVSFLAV
jgi:hypothetical protein